jgi:hypothetical protein
MWSEMAWSKTPEAQWAYRMQVENARLQQQAALLTGALNQTLQQMGELKGREQKEPKEKRANVKNGKQRRTPPLLICLSETVTPTLSPMLSPCSIPATPFRPPPGLSSPKALEEDCKVRPTPSFLSCPSTPETLTPGASPMLSPCSGPATPLFRPPPGLSMMPPPGLSSPKALEEDCEEASTGSSTDDAQSPDPEKTVIINTSTLGGTTSTRLMWRISNPHGKFRVSAGFPLVSPLFNAGGLGDMRMMFAPGELWASQDSKRKPKRKSELVSAPPYGSLQFKFTEPSDSAESTHVSAYFILGSSRLGPVSLDLKETTTQKCDLPFDWREHLKGNEHGSLCLGVELIQK